jgi:hypothetical protein
MTPDRASVIPAVEALPLLAFLSERVCDLDEARYIVASALLMTCDSMSDAVRCLEVVDGGHVERGIDLYGFVRGRTP